MGQASQLVLLTIQFVTLLIPIKNRNDIVALQPPVSPRYTRCLSLKLVAVCFQKVLFSKSCKLITKSCRIKCNEVRPGLGLFRFARRYSGNRYCFLFLRVLRCFTSPGTLPDVKHRDIPQSGMGSPIRKSTDQRLLVTSP